MASFILVARLSRSIDDNPQPLPPSPNENADIVIVQAVTNTPPVSVQKNTTKPSLAGLRPKCTTSHDLFLVREVTAAQAHVTPNGETKERLEISALRASATRKLSCNVTWKSIQDRYKRLKAHFDKRDAQEAVMSGVGGEVGAMDELSISMKEARDDKGEAAMNKRNIFKDKEAEKEPLGAVIRNQSQNRRGARENLGVKFVSRLDQRSEEAPRNRRRKLGGALKEGLNAELQEFSNAIARGDEERNCIDQ